MLPRINMVYMQKALKKNKSKLPSQKVAYVLTYINWIFLGIRASLIVDRASGSMYLLKFEALDNLWYLHLFKLHILWTILGLSWDLNFHKRLQFHVQHFCTLINSCWSHKVHDISWSFQINQVPFFREIYAVKYFEFTFSNFNHQVCFDFAL